MASPDFRSLVLDLGGVLLSFSATNIDTLAPRQVKNVLDSPAWHEYERGRVSQQECYKSVADMFNIDAKAWKVTMDQLTETLRPNMEFIAAIKQLKASNPRLGVYGASNISQPDFELIKPMIDGWEIFDDIYPSSASGCRKPEIAYYQKFLEFSGLEAKSCIFVDDRPENVITAQSLGFQGVLFEDTEVVTTTLFNLLGDPVARGMAFLRQNAKNLFCQTNTGDLHRDNFSQLLILQCIGDLDLVTLEKKGTTWNYFIGEPIFAGTVYPNDSDTTSLAMTLLEDIPMSEKKVAMDMMLSNLNPDGLPLCWFEKSRPRLCYCISANVFRFFCLHDCGEQLSKTYAFLCQVLRTEAYVFGTRYYQSPDWFFYILSDLCSKRPSDPGLQEMRDLLISRLQGRIGCDKDVLSASMRLLCAQALGIANSRDLDTILAAQHVDGGWERAWLWRYGKEAVRIGSRGVVTAMAVKGIQRAQTLSSTA